MNLYKVYIRDSRLALTLVCSLFFTISTVSIFSTTNVFAINQNKLIVMGKNNVLTKQILIYNNTNEPIYPVIEAPILLSDPWLQAVFGETNITANTYAQTNIHRVYVNPNTGGILPSTFVNITLPFYSQLVANPNPTVANQYIDWWNAMRIYIYDDLPSLTAVYTADKANPVSPVTSGLSCASGTCEPLTIFANTVGLQLNDPYQLLEYTFANVNTGQGVPFPINTNFVDYDISYVDNVYLPAAMEPDGNAQIGYTGTVMNLFSFRKILNQFVTVQGWPIYTKSPSYPNKKLPGTYNVIIGNQPETPNNIFANIQTNWNACTTNASNPQYSNCQNVKNLFDLNAANYQAACGQSAPTLEVYLQHVYGWVAFNCAGVTNDLASTPGANYPAAAQSYIALQYDYNLTPSPKPFAFNPYVSLIHSSTYLNMNAYAFSIDDAVGNMNVLGTGIVIAIGGVTGLPNPNPYNPNAVANVNLGAPSPGGPAWSMYGVCTTIPNTPFPTGGLNFQITSATYPCPVSIMNSNGKIYHFTLLQSPPFVGGNTTQYIQCASSDTWCNGVNLDFNTGHDIDTPPPF